MIPTHQCKQCKEFKEWIFFGLDKKGRTVRTQSDGTKWRGAKCGSCVLINQRKHKEYLGSRRLYPKLNCKHCNIGFKQKAAVQQYCSPKCNRLDYYKNNKDTILATSKRWVVKTCRVKLCKECNKEFKTSITGTKDYCGKECRNSVYRRYRKQYYRKNNTSTHTHIKREILTKYCIKCEKEFTTKLIEQKYCSKQCTIKPKMIKEIFSRLCSCCSSEFQTTREGKKYCSKRCARKVQHTNPITKNKRKAYDKMREMKKIKRMPSWANRKIIESIYDNRPEGYEIDHIIPLNGKDVCGFHVEYNLQYLNGEDNVLKSNSFDGTYENESWKKYKK